MSGRRLLACLLLSVSLLSAVAYAETSGTKRPKPPSKLCAAGKCVDSVETGQQQIKWNPGHYMASESILRGPGDLVKLRAEMKGLQGHPGVLGYRVLVSWSSIEKSKGVYDFTLIDQVMSQLKTGFDTPKRMVLVIEPGTFAGRDLRSDDGSFLPLYLQQDSANGVSPAAGSYGWWHYPNGGYCAALYRAPVMNRFIQLMQAVGNHFDAEPYFEGMMVQEDSWMIQRLFQAPDYSTDAMTTQLKNLLTAMVQSFPHTSVIMQSTFNGTQANETAFVQWYVANRVSPSSADVVGQSAFANGYSALGWGSKAYIGVALDASGKQVTDLRPQAAGMMDVEAFEIVGNYYQKYGGPFSPQDVLEALNKTYQATHAFWTYLYGTEVYRGGSVPTETKWSNLAPFLDKNPLQRTAYPANYP
jgi:hypothetical protein